MFKAARIAMAAVFLFSMGVAGAATPMSIVGPDADNPTVIGGDVVYGGLGVEYYWTNTPISGATGYGTLDNLAVVNSARLTIGSDPIMAALGDIVVNFAEGDGLGLINVGDASSGGRLQVGNGVWGVKSVIVRADALNIVNGSVNIASSAMMGPGKVNRVSVRTLVLDNTVAPVQLSMDGSASRLDVSGAAFVGVADGSAVAGNAVLSVAGGGAWFGEGIVLGNSGVLANQTASAASILVGGIVGSGYAGGDICMTGDSFIAGGNGLAIFDASEQYSAGNVPLSSLVVRGAGNGIAGFVDASSLKEMYVDGEVELNGTLLVRDYRQVSGGFDGSSGLLIVEGANAAVTGGVFGGNVAFANPDLETFVFAGAGINHWADANPVRVATLDGGNVVAGLAGAGQTVSIGKFAGMNLWRSVFEDIDVDVAGRGHLNVQMNLGDTVLIYSISAAEPVVFHVESGDSFRFGYGNIYLNGVMAGDYDAVDVAPLVLVQAGSGAVVDIPDFSFAGMFGSYGLASVDAAGSFGLVGYASSGVDFDGARADAAHAHSTLRPAYGDTVNRGLSDMAYRAGMVMVGRPCDPADALPALVPVTPDRDTPEYDSAMVNLLNLADIAAGRAGTSIVSLYNGSNIFGVNQISASTALSHAQIGMRRSDELRSMNNLVGDGVSGGDAYASAIMNQRYANRFWAGGFGLWENAGARRGFAGYKYRSGGIAVGYDRLFGPNVIVGGSFAATFGDFEDKSALGHDSDIDSYSVNLYASYTHHSGLFGTLFGGYTYSDNDIRELRLHNLTDLVWNTAGYHTNSWLAGGKLGYDWKPADCFTITPSAGLTWITARSSSHTEYLDGVAVARFGRMKTTRTYLPIELGFGYDAMVGERGKLNLALNFGYAYNFDNDRIKGNIWQFGFANDTPYAAVSREPGRHTFTVGGGLRYTVGRFDIGAKYDYARKSKMDSHRLYGTVGIGF